MTYKKSIAAAKQYLENDMNPLCWNYLQLNWPSQQPEEQLNNHICLIYLFWKRWISQEN